MAPTCQSRSRTSITTLSCSHRSRCDRRGCGVDIIRDGGVLLFHNVPPCKRTGLYPHLHPPAALLGQLMPPPSSQLLQNAINNECKHSAQLSLADIPRSNVSPVCAVIDMGEVHLFHTPFLLFQGTHLRCSFLPRQGPSTADMVEQY